MFRRSTLSYVFVFAAIAALVACSGKKSASSLADGANASGASESGLGGSESSASGASGTNGDISGVAMPTVHFDFNEFTVRSADREMLSKASEALKKSTGAKITVEGHCDERGSNEYNLALGERRAQSVKSYLQKLGVDASRLSTISYGEERPAETGSGEGAWSKNRRAELVLNR